MRKNMLGLFMPARLSGSILLVGFTIFVMALSGKAATPPIPPAKLDAPLAAAAGKQTAVFAGGCFWGTQAVFERVKGVLKTTAGYAGGSAETATYRQVITETTGHAESVEVIYDLAIDPNETINFAQDPAYAGILDSLRKRHATLVAKAR